MEPATLAFLELGFSLSKILLEFIKHPAANRGPQGRVARLPEIQDYIRESAARMEGSIQAAVATIIDKIERDRLEELISRTRNLAALTAHPASDQTLYYAMMLRESVDYAHNRLVEDKLQWLGPYLSGYSVFLAHLLYNGNLADGELGLYERAMAEARHRVLDVAAPLLLEEYGHLPWDEVARFLRGEDNAILGQLSLAIAAPAPGPIPAGGPSPRAVSSPGRISELAIMCFKNAANFALAPNIPAAKIEGASKKLIPLADPGDPMIALLDVTVFGGNKDGVAFFETYFVSSDLWAPAYRFTYREVAGQVRIAGREVKFKEAAISPLKDETARALYDFLTKASELHG